VFLEEVAPGQEANKLKLWKRYLHKNIYNKIKNFFLALAPHLYDTSSSAVPQLLSFFLFIKRLFSYGSFPFLSQKLFSY